MDTEFTSVIVQPTHATNTVRVTWQLPVVWEASDVFVYRSDTGTVPWELRNEETPVIGTLGFYEDDAGPYKWMPSQPLTYRLAARRHSDGAILKSPPVTVAHSTLDSRALTVVRHILRNEYELMWRNGNGQPAWLVFPKLTGPTNPDVDLPSGEINYGDLASTQGQPRGWLPPIATRVMLRATGRRNYGAPVDAGTQDVTIRKARFLAHPRPRNGVVVVFPLSDDRYVVGNRIDQHLFMGVYAVAHEAELYLLPRNDVRYQIPLPMMPASI